MHKANTQVNVLGTLTAANRALRPGDARFIDGKDTGRCSLRIAKISQEYAILTQQQTRLQSFDGGEVGGSSASPADNVKAACDAVTEGGATAVPAAVPAAVTTAAPSVAGTPEAMRWRRPLPEVNGAVAYAAVTDGAVVAAA